MGIKKWHRLKFEFLTYLFSGLIITASLMWIFAWWAHYSDYLLLDHYGYNFDSFNNGLGRYENIETINYERVKQLETSYYGIGWPLKAIMSFVFYSPYLLIVYPTGQAFRRRRSRKK